MAQVIVANAKWVTIPLFRVGVPEYKDNQLAETIKAVEMAVKAQQPS